MTHNNNCNIINQNGIYYKIVTTTNKNSSNVLSPIQFPTYVFNGLEKINISNFHEWYKSINVLTLLNGKDLNMKHDLSDIIDVNDKLEFQTKRHKNLFKKLYKLYPNIKINLLSKGYIDDDVLLDKPIVKIKEDDSSNVLYSSFIKRFILYFEQYYYFTFSHNGLKYKEIFFVKSNNINVFEVYLCSSGSISTISFFTTFDTEIEFLNLTKKLKKELKSQLCDICIPIITDNTVHIENPSKIIKNILIFK